jgi:hypothetical protein
MKTAVEAAPIPIYFFLPLAPFNKELAAIVLEEKLTLLLVCGYASSYAVGQIRRTAGLAHRRKQKGHPPTDHYDE